MSKRAVRLCMHCQVTSSDVLHLAAWIVDKAEDSQAQLRVHVLLGPLGCLQIRLLRFMLRSEAQTVSPEQFSQRAARSMHDGGTFGLHVEL
jgi:hypothetical protein